MNKLTKIENVICTTSLLLASFLVFVNVFLRYVFHSGLSWSEEMIRYLFAIVTFLGLGMAVKKGQSINIDILLVLLKDENIKKHIMHIINVIQFTFACVVSMIAYSFTWQIYKTGQVSSAMQIPMFCIYLLVTVAFILLAINTIYIVFPKKDK